MRAFLAIARDSFREAADHRISTFMVAVAAAVGIAAFLVSGLVEVPVEGLVAAALADAHAGRRLGAERVDGRTVDLVAAEAPAREGAAPFPEPARAYLARMAEATAAALADRGVRGVHPVDVALPSPATGTARARLALDYDPLDVRGATRLAIGVGISAELDPDEDLPRILGRMTGREAVLTIESSIVQLVAGWAGLVVFVVATAGFVPSMLSGGTAHLLLAKPVRRATLLLGKYAGGVAFVAAHATLVTALAAAGIAARTGFFDLRFLAAPLPVTAVFAVVYAASVLAAVLFETPVVSILAALTLWVACWGAFAAKTGPRSVEAVFGQRVEVAATVRLAIDAVYWVLPKTTDIYVAFDEHLKRGRRPLAVERAAAELRGDIDPGLILGTSAAFTAALLAAACFAFARRDY